MNTNIFETEKGDYFSRQFTGQRPSNFILPVELLRQMVILYAQWKWHCYARRRKWTGRSRL